MGPREYNYRTPAMVVLVVDPSPDEVLLDGIKHSLDVEKNIGLRSYISQDLGNEARILVEKAPLSVPDLQDRIKKGDVATVVMPTDFATSLTEVGGKEMPVYLALEKTDRHLPLIPVSDSKEQAKALGDISDHFYDYRGEKADLPTEKAKNPPKQPHFSSMDYMATLLGAVRAYAWRTDQITEGREDPVQGLKDLGVTLIGNDGQEMGGPGLAKFLYERQELAGKRDEKVDEAIKAQEKSDKKVLFALSRLSDGKVDWKKHYNSEFSRMEWRTESRIQNPGAVMFKIEEALGLPSHAIVPVRLATCKAC